MVLRSRSGLLAQRVGLLHFHVPPEDLGELGDRVVDIGRRNRLAPFRSAGPPHGLDERGHAEAAREDTLPVEALDQFIQRSVGVRLAEPGS
jgi:hypothetical protein